MYQKKGCATFAYFSVTTSGNTTATTVTATTGKIGTLLASGGTTPLSLTLSATDMSQATLGGNDSIDYYATTSGTKKTQTPGQATVPVGEDLYSTISSVALSGAESGTKYHCQGKFTVSVNVKDLGTASDADDSGSIVATDGKLYLKATEESGVKVGIAEDEEDAPAESGVTTINHDIQSLISAGKTFWVTYDFDGTQTSVTGKVEAAFKISNTNAPQNYLANRQITVTLTPDEGAGKLACDIVEGE